MSLLPVYTVISFSLPYIYSILLNNLIYNRRKSKSPPIQVFVREEWGLITFRFPQGESQMCPSPLYHTQLSVKLRGWGDIGDMADKQPAIIPPQLRGLVSFSHSLYTLQHLYDKKYDKFFFNVKTTTFYTCKTDIFFLFPGHWDVAAVHFVCLWKQSRWRFSSDCEGLCQCLHVCLHSCPQSIS